MHNKFKEKEKMSIDPVVSMVLESLRDSVMGEVKFLYGVKEQVEEMKVEIKWMQCFLEDADHHHQLHSQSSVFCQWVKQIKEATLDAEDAIDSYSVKAICLKRRFGIFNLAERYACLIKEGMNIHAVGSEIESVKSRLSTLRTRLQVYSIRDIRLEEGVFASTWRNRSYGHIHEHNVVGLNTNINEVVEMVVGGEHKILSIYGMGGLGKTTLAKQVYHDERVTLHFRKFVWVCVSRHFKPRDIWESMLKEVSLERVKVKELTDAELTEKLCEIQKQTMCLVVLDDIWSFEDWKILSVAFPHVEVTMSKVLLTTRNKELAEVVDCGRGTYGRLKHLEPEESLELLTIIALETRDNSQERDRMRRLGEEMLSHCKGLPLAITVLAGILATKNSLTEWQTVHDNINSYLRRGSSHNEAQCLGVFEVLAYSYYDLPHDLKPCFLYLSLFPEDHEIRTKTLLKLWIAEGFISGDGKDLIEDAAERYFEELVNRCMVQVGSVGSIRRFKTCRVHDLMREMCLSKAKEDNFIHNFSAGNPTDKANFLGKIRRLSHFWDGDESISLSGYGRNSQLRSLILNSKGEGNLAPVRMGRHFKLLKVLVLEGVTYHNVLLRQVGNLILLRYLSLKDSVINCYPSLENLKLLETLDLRISSVSDCLLPGVSAIWKMKHLRHLYLPSYCQYSIGGHEARISENPNLQTLVNFPPPHCSVSQVFKFPNLRKLQLEGENIVNMEQGSWDTLRGDRQNNIFTRLSSFSMGRSRIHDLGRMLRADFSSISKLSITGKMEEFPQANEFPPDLIKLTMTCSCIEDASHIETTLGELKNLQILRLDWDSFKGTRLSFRRDTFPKLKALYLQVLRELEVWRVEEGAMPELEYLAIDSCRNLEAFPAGLRYRSNLKKHITHMPHHFQSPYAHGETSGANTSAIVSARTHTRSNTL